MSVNLILWFHECLQCALRLHSLNSSGKSKVQLTWRDVCECAVCTYLCRSSWVSSNTVQSRSDCTVFAAVYIALPFWLHQRTYPRTCVGFLLRPRVVMHCGCYRYCHSHCVMPRSLLQVFCPVHVPCPFSSYTIISKKWGHFYRGGGMSYHLLPWFQPGTHSASANAYFYIP